MADSTNSQSQQRPSVIDVLKRNRIDTFLWLSRMLTIIFSACFVLPFFGPSSSFYYKALLASGATNALRLHQRVPNIRLTREYFATLFIEDSAHYLIYALLFNFAPPITLALIPPVLFALLHAARFTKQLLVAANLPVENSVLGKAIGAVDNNHVTLLRWTALNEIMLFPFTVMLLFSGSGSLLMPFLYFNFLKMRYASQRNPYTRTVFYELRLTFETLAANPRCPRIIGSFLLGIVRLVSRFAPPHAPPNVVPPQ